MRQLLLLLVISPMAVFAQINRSAREFAGEQVQQYVTSKLFKGDGYKAVSFGELKPKKDGKAPELAWTFEHSFEITQKTYPAQKDAQPKIYKFLFYLDDRMRVIRAETFFNN